MPHEAITPGQETGRTTRGDTMLDTMLEPKWLEPKWLLSVSGIGYWIGPAWVFGSV